MDTRSKLAGAALASVDELKANAGADGRIDIFEKGGIRVAVRVQSWGAQDRKRIILYSLERVWAPHVIWQARTGSVQVTFDEPTWTINVNSGTGTLIFQTTLPALAPRKVPWEW